MKPLQQKANWRFIAVGSDVWLESRGSWFPGTVLSVGNNRAERTRVCISVAGWHATVYREVHQLYERRVKLRGEDKPANILTLKP